MTFPKEFTIAPSSTDTELLAAIEHKSSEALSILYDRYSSGLYRVLKSTSAEYADYILEETFIHIYHHPENSNLNYGVFHKLFIISMELLKKKDNKAYLKMLSSYSETIYPRAFAMLKQNKSVQELLQRSMIRVWKSYLQFEINNNQSGQPNILRDMATLWIKERKRRAVKSTNIPNLSVERLHFILSEIVFSFSAEALAVIKAVFIDGQIIEDIANDWRISVEVISTYIFMICRKLSKTIDVDKTI